MEQRSHRRVQRWALTLNVSGCRRGELTARERPVPRCRASTLSEITRKKLLVWSRCGFIAVAHHRMPTLKSPSSERVRSPKSPSKARLMFRVAPADIFIHPRLLRAAPQVVDPTSTQTLYCRHEQKVLTSPVTGAKIRISRSTSFDRGHRRHRPHTCVVRIEASLAPHDPPRASLAP